METQKAMEHYELSKRHLCLGKNPQLWIQHQKVPAGRHHEKTDTAST
jgi:hypothetical protein